MQTKYSHFSDSEFVSLLDEKAQSSEIILELCQRLDKMNARLHPNTNCEVECPVCEAPLTVELDEENLMFELELRK